MNKKEALKNVKEILKQRECMHTAAAFSSLCPPIGSTLKMSEKSLTWGAENIEVCQYPDGHFDDEDIVAYLTLAMFSDSIVAKVVGYGAQDEDAQRLFGLTVPYIKLELSLDNRVIETKYMSVLDIEEVYGA